MKILIKKIFYVQLDFQTMMLGSPDFQFLTVQALVYDDPSEKGNL